MSKLIDGVRRDPNTVQFSETSRNAATSGNGGPRRAGIIASVKVDKDASPKLRFSFHPSLLAKLDWKPGETSLDMRLAPPQVAGGTTTVLLSPLNNGKGRAISLPSKSAKCARCVTVFALPRHMLWHRDQGSGDVAMDDIEVEANECAFHLPF